LLLRFARSVFGMNPKPNLENHSGRRNSWEKFDAFDLTSASSVTSLATNLGVRRLARIGAGPAMQDDRVSQEPKRQESENHYYAALDLVAEGNDERAVEEYRKSIAADPNCFDEAIEASQRISELDPDDVLAHTSLSILYQKKGMVPEAEAESNKARVLGWKQQLKQKNE
jgi:tetratricopeptide (TPR) repeat protein